MSQIVISPKQVKDKQGVVILPVKEYRRLLAAAVPTYYLKGKAAKDLDKLVAEGMREYRAGKTRTIRSLSNLD